MSANPPFLPPPTQPIDRKPRQKSNKMNELYLTSCLAASVLLVAGSKLPTLIPFSFCIMLVATIVLLFTVVFFTEEENEGKVFVQLFGLIIFAIGCLAVSYAIFDKLGGKL